MTSLPLVRNKVIQRSLLGLSGSSLPAVCGSGGKLCRFVLGVADRIQVALGAFRTARLAQRAAVQDDLV